MLARCIGPDGETWKEMHVEDHVAVIKVAVMVPLAQLLAVPDPSEPMMPSWRTVEFVRERVFGPDDGGPLAIFRCTNAYTSEYERKTKLDCGHHMIAIEMMRRGGEHWCQTCMRWKHKLYP